MGSCSQKSNLTNSLKHAMDGFDKIYKEVKIREIVGRTELEYMIEDCIKEGDFEKAELLSDTLANREFAVKIAHAFAAKKCQEQLEKQKDEEKKKRMKKIRWTFDAKERWQMKGNM